MSTVKAYKLTTGEEVIGRPMGSGNDTFYKIGWPHILRMMPSNNGEVGLAFVPWLLSKPDAISVSIPREKVILTVDVSSHVAAQFNNNLNNIMSNMETYSVNPPRPTREN